MHEGSGNLGMVEASGASMPVTGVEYVLSTPSGRAVLRPLRYPIYDSEIIENGQTICCPMFVDMNAYCNGTMKNPCDTNMTKSGELGHPNLYDLIGFNVELEYGCGAADFNDIYNKMIFRWIFGTNTVFLRTTVKRIPQGIGPQGFNSVGTIITQGLGTLGNFFTFTTPDRKARRIDSTEAFRNELCPCTTISITGSGGSGQCKIFTYMIGILFTNL